MRSIVPAFVCSSVLMLPAFLAAADWPQYRADGQRSGYTVERLPAQLHLQWTYLAPHPPEPAWPDVYWQRQTYDLAYQPVVARGMLFYGSSADCKVYALDAASGRLKWSFFTDGPVRFAPVVWHDRVFVISDDGHLYCLAASDGSLLWKKQGGVDKNRILGNGRMVSRCPARGGPVIQDDVLYFVRPRANRGWCAVKGSSMYNRPIIARPSKVDLRASGKSLSYSAQLWQVGVDTAKEALVRRLASDRAAPLASDRHVHFPTGLDESFYGQLTAEVYDPNKRRWIKIRPRNEALDTWCYAMAAAYHPRVGVQKWREAQWAGLERAMEPEGDLFAALAERPAPPAPTAPEPQPTDDQPDPPPRKEQRWISKPSKKWLR